MATCLSGTNPKKKKKKDNTRNNNSDNNKKSNEEYKWIQQQKLLISRVDSKPNQYVILSQKEIHDTINKILNKYRNKTTNWHWFNGRFEPVIDEYINHQNMNHSQHNTLDQYELSSIHHHHHHNDHNDNTSNTSNTSNSSKHQLLRMNGHYILKCKTCFRETMKNEYITQKDILFLIKYALKFFIQYKGEYKHNCSWKQQLNNNNNNNRLHGNYMNNNNHHRYNESLSYHPKPIHDENGMIIHNDDEITKFHSNFKFSKPLLPNLHPPTQHTHSTDLIEENRNINMNININPSSSEYGTGKNNEINDNEHSITNTNTNTTTHLNNNQIIQNKQENADYFVPQQYINNNNNNKHKYIHSRTITNNSISTLSHLSGTIPIIRQNESDSSDNIHEFSKSKSVPNKKKTKKLKNKSKKLKKSKKSESKKTKQLKHELLNIKTNYHSMLKDYNNLQMFLSQNGIHYNPNSINNHQNDRNSLLIQIKTYKKNKIDLENENNKLQSIIRSLREEIRKKDEIISKFNNNNNNNNNKIMSPSLNGSVVINISPEHSPISPLTDDNTSDIDDDDDDDDDEDKMVQRIFFDNNDDDNFYAELTTLYNNNNDDELNDYFPELINKRTSSILDILHNKEIISNHCNHSNNSGHGIVSRKRSQSNSLLPVNNGSLAELQKEEDIILQNEFDLFRLLIDDRNDEETLILNGKLQKLRRGSINNNNYSGIDALIDHITSPQFDIETLCNFLPLILFKASKCEKEISSKSINGSLVLISRLSKENRLWENDDIRQKLQFLSSSFSKTKDDENPIKNIFHHSHKIWLQKCTEKIISSTSINLNKASMDISRHKLDGDDLILFWENIMNLNEGYISYINYNDLSSKYSFNYRDPVNSGLPPLQKVKVCKELKSANKPLLCELWVKQHENSNHLMLSSHIILKRGDDLRKDYAIMNIFKYMNYIWKKERDSINNKQFKNLSFNGSIVKILTFNVVPFNDEFGGIELITNCVPLRHVKYIQCNMKNEHFYQLITSAAASYIGSFICGVRDRHFENILIRVADCTLFHIDFGYCCGETIKFSLDASPFGITNTLKDLINTNTDLYNNKFIPIACDSYMALRKNYKSLIKFAVLAFSYIKKQNDIENFIKNRLKIFDNDKKKKKKWNEKYVKEWLIKKLMTAPKDNKTIRKNKLRKFLSPTIVDIDQKLIK